MFAVLESYHMSFYEYIAFQEYVSPLYNLAERSIHPIHWPSFPLIIPCTYIDIYMYTNLYQIYVIWPTTELIYHRILLENEQPKSVENSGDSV